MLSLACAAFMTDMPTGVRSATRSTASPRSSNASLDLPVANVVELRSAG
jgi:hypothetical protein